MLRLAAIGLVGAISAAAAAQAVISYSQAQSGPALRSAQSVASQAVSTPAPPAQPDAAAAQAGPDGTSASIAKSADGHYWAEAVVDGHEVRFLVDTGATAVALTADDATRLGLVPATLNYTAKVMTANGPARAAQVKLDSVSIAGAEVRDVDALVIENGLSTSLLGMTYLGRLSQFEATKTSLVLRP